jgi:uncharacterized protein YacL
LKGGHPVADIKNEFRKHPIALLIVGTLGAAFTGIFLISSYKSTVKVSDLIMPLIYGFIPFVFFFILLKTGINELINRKNK